MALAPSAGSTSASTRPVSQGTGGSNLPSQFASISGPRPPSGPGTGTTSMAPGLTLGSQSLQSPWAGDQPSLSMSAFMSVTTQVLLSVPVEPVEPLEPLAKETPPTPS